MEGHVGNDLWGVDFEDCTFPKPSVSPTLQDCLSRLTEASPAAQERETMESASRCSGWVAKGSRFGDRFLEEDMAALAERIAASMLDDDSQSSSSASDYNMSATTSEEGSPKAWNLNARGFPADSRPASPSWSSSSYDYDQLPSVSYGDTDSRSPDAFMSNRRTPFQRAPVSHQEVFSLQQQLESLSAQQLHTLKKALAECQKGRQGRQSETQNRGRSCGQPEKGNRGLREQSRNYHDQARKQAERRAISALASQQPNERLAIESRASRRGVICGAAATPPSTPKPVPTPSQKENGTGVFLPMAVVSSMPSHGKSKAGSTLQATPRPFQPPLSKSTLGPNRRDFNGQLCSQSKQPPHKPATSPPKVAVVDCSELMKIPVVNFNQRCRAQAAPPARGPTGPVSKPVSGARRPSKANQRAVDRQIFLQRAAYGAHGESLPQQGWVQTGQSRCGTDNLGLPEEWVY
ncbi:hypothetical protein KFL_002130090 [Klebsormidium nitens]|uniref:Uncharacterized protein n=1 Tax=Klebsormidium nitens TaxID=105231 RepID=A0A1Y1I378_KLENI|nr:hypothetical protein KFL_002130090 [Klebsormidium nitens]|eukprot:GAQ84933.1 hypothetical protein KFL_002130090 [Klebsormidium nitens]